ncbi:MAG: hypothetical protein LBQ14_09530 [Treponema sp.]|jgi:hypothetical protein|nr:hypothetical protein [Treponema sp.]
MKRKNPGLFTGLCGFVCMALAFSGCLQPDSEEPEIRGLEITSGGNPVSVLDIDPGESVTLEVSDPDLPPGSAASFIAGTDSAAFSVARSGPSYTITGITPGGMGLAAFSGRGKTGTVRVFIRNWAQGEVVNRHTLYADGDTSRGGAYKLVTDAGFHYEAPDGLSSGVPKTMYHAVHNTDHITQQYDDELKKNVFAFSLHYDPANPAAADGDMNSGFPDRQRLELKTMNTGPFDAGKPEDLMYSTGGGDTFTHRWKFRLPRDFAVSTEFTHIHQIKPEGGDAGNPVFSLTARRKSDGSTVMQLIYRGPLRPSGDPSQNSYPCEVKLRDFLGEWVRVEETITYDNPGAYQFKVVRIRDLKVLMHYVYFPQKYEEKKYLDPFVTYRQGNTYIRPKFGFYRRIRHLDSFSVVAGDVLDLKDETILYADFELEKLK